MLQRAAQNGGVGRSHEDAGEAEEGVVARNTAGFLLYAFNLLVSILVLSL